MVLRTARAVSVECARYYSNTDMFTLRLHAGAIRENAHKYVVNIYL